MVDVLVGRGWHQQQLDARASRREGYLTDRRFSQKFQQLLGQKNPSPLGRRTTVGRDQASAAAQAIASVQGRNNAPKLRQRASLESYIDPVSAAMNHSVRNRSVEQGGNNPTRTASAGMSSTANTSVMQQLKQRGLV